MELNDLAELVVEHLASIVNQAEESAIVDSGDWKERYQHLTIDLRNLIADALVRKKNMQDDGLTFSAIEAEGFLRCALTVRNIVDSVNDLYGNN